MVLRLNPSYVIIVIIHLVLDRIIYSRGHRKIIIEIGMLKADMVLGIHGVKNHVSSIGYDESLGGLEERETPT